MFIIINLVSECDIFSMPFNVVALLFYIPSLLTVHNNNNVIHSFDMLHYSKSSENHDDNNISSDLTKINELKFLTFTKWIPYICKLFTKIAKATYIRRLKNIK